jgi:putative addiction module antidote
MTRTIKIRRIGGSLGAIFPKELLDEMNVGEGDELVVTRKGADYGLAARDEGDAKVLAAFERGRAQYRETLRKLAE